MSMTLEQYRKALGLTHGQMSNESGVRRSVLEQAEDGEPIAQPLAEEICAFLSKRFKRNIIVGQVKDLKTC
jgi:DNA-binding XRE family transcriptional regulator